MAMHILKHCLAFLSFNLEWASFFLTFYLLKWNINAFTIYPLALKVLTWFEKGKKKELSKKPKEKMKATTVSFI